MDMNEAQFRQQLQGQGYSEAQSLEYGPNSVSDMHTHDSSAFAFVLSGEFTLVTVQAVPPSCLARSSAESG